ncbi:transmembrane BAX inhibitor [Chamberlinius hualienensis]
MENKLYNQPAYNTEYNSPPTEYGNVNYPTHPPNQLPPPYYASYPQPGGYPNATPVQPTTGYYVAAPQGIPPSAPPPVGFVNAVDPQPIPPEDEHHAEATNFGSSFSDKNIRRAFVRKVYLILMVQLLFTFGIVALFFFQKNVKQFVRTNPPVYYASYAVFLVTYMTLVCCSSVRRRYPANVICLSIFTMSMAYMTGTITSFYDTQTVFIAAGMCAGVCLGITLLSMWSKFDVTGCGFFLAMISWTLFWFGIMCAWTYNDVMYTVYCALFTILMMMFLAFDTQLILGGKRHELSPEDYIAGAVCLYVDIVLIFWLLLSLFGRR